jgi:hypothetical protein
MVKVSWMCVGPTCAKSFNSEYIFFHGVMLSLFT